MKAAIRLILFLLIANPALAQLSDDFSDGDLLNPEWTGDTPDFIVADGRLRLMASGAGSSQLRVSTPVDPTAEQLSYSFLVDMDFAPSGSNFAEVFLRDSNDADKVITLRFGGISGSAFFFRLVA